MHRQARRGLVQAAIFTIAAVVSAVVPHDTGAWLPLHLFVVGGLLTAISATTQMLAVTWSSAPAPAPWLATAQRWCLAVGTIVVCIGREADANPLIAVGGTAVVAAVAAMIPILVVIRRNSVTDRFAPAIDAYVVAMVCGVVGTTLAIVLATGRDVADGAQLRVVHLTLNLFGLVGLVVAATLPYFAATQARRKMSPRATPVSMRVTAASLSVGAFAAGLGQWRSERIVSAMGLLTYAVGLSVLATMLPIYGRRQLAWAGPRLIQLAAGVAWWIATTVGLAVVVGTGGDDRPVLRSLVIGGFGQILASSLAYLGPVLRGGGHQQLAAGFAITRSWLSLIAGNLAALGALLTQPSMLAVGLLVWFADMIVRAVRLIDTRDTHVQNGDQEVRAVGERA